VDITAGVVIQLSDNTPRSRLGKRYSSYSFSILALDGGVSGQRHAPVLDTRLEEKSFDSAGNRTPIQSVVRYYTDLATPIPKKYRPTK
jgi:hypothetical protein